MRHCSAGHGQTSFHSFFLVAQRLDSLEEKIAAMRKKLQKPIADDIVKALKERQSEAKRPAEADIDDELAMLETTLDPIGFDHVSHELPGYARRMHGPHTGRSDVSLLSLESAPSIQSSIGSVTGSISSPAESPSKAAIGSSLAHGGGSGDAASNDVSFGYAGSFGQIMKEHTKRRAQVLGELANSIGATPGEVFQAS